MVRTEEINLTIILYELGMKVVRIIKLIEFIITERITFRNNIPPTPLPHSGSPAQSAK